MQGKSYSIPFGMKFKKYYCHKCGSKLLRKQTHRVVSKDDPDYYKYQNRNEFPRRDWDVYEYCFVCDKCNYHIAYSEQEVIRSIQKKYRSKILSKDKINKHYQTFKKRNNLKRIITNILVTSICLIIIFFFMIAYYQIKDIRKIIIYSSIILFIIGNVIFNNIRSLKNEKNQNEYYSIIKEDLYHKLYTYSKNNKALINEAEICYCYHCNKKFTKEEVIEYLEEDTALCPNCKVDAVIPDSIDESLNMIIIEEMNKYWF